MSLYSTLQIGITCDPCKTFSLSKLWAVSIDCITANSNAEVDLPVSHSKVT